MEMGTHWERMGLHVKVCVVDILSILCAFAIFVYTHTDTVHANMYRIVEQCI